jgi:hypothetical protein
MMRRLLQPSLVIFIALLTAVVVTGAVLLWPRNDTRPRPEPVPKGDHEVVWLSYASNFATWERFIKGMDTAAQRLAKDPKAPKVDVDVNRAFPEESTAVPEVVLSVEGVSGKLHVRWCRLTANWKSINWIDVLLARDPPPLAIIGGSFSDAAIRQAAELQEKGTKLGKNAPIYFVAQATKTRLTRDVAPSPEAIPYQNRTFRCCFSNARLTESICDFIWRSEGLRPTCKEYYVPYWEDDRYSEDLRDQFNVILHSPPYERDVTPDLFLPSILTSIGTFDWPNREESETARKLLEHLRAQPSDSRPLLVLSGQLQPSRRFLRALSRLDPNVLPRFIAASGDVVSFNTIYRDRNVAWSIQDFPCDLVLFAHREPVSEDAGFRTISKLPGPGMGVGPASTATDDVLLYADMIEAILLATYREKEGLVASAGEMQEALRGVRWDASLGQVTLEGNKPRLFDDSGNREPGTGECIVWLHPVRSEGMLLPEAALRVYSRAGQGTSGEWKLIWQDEHLPFEGWHKGD